MSTEPKAPDVGGPELPPGCTHGVCETCHLRVCQNIVAELRTRLTEAEGALETSRRRHGQTEAMMDGEVLHRKAAEQQRDTERARADRLFRQLSFKADDVSRMRGCIVNLKAEAAALQKRVAELEGGRCRVLLDRALLALQFNDREGALDVLHEWYASKHSEPTDGEAET